MKRICALSRLSTFLALAKDIQGFVYTGLLVVQMGIFVMCVPFYVCELDIILKWKAK